MEIFYDDFQGKKVILLIYFGTNKYFYIGTQQRKRLT